MRAFASCHIRSQVKRTVECGVTKLDGPDDPINNHSRIVGSPFRLQGAAGDTLRGTGDTAANERVRSRLRYLLSEFSLTRYDVYASGTDRACRGLPEPPAGQRRPLGTAPAATPPIGRWSRRGCDRVR